ncbi:MAG: chemotaxis protein CheW [Nitrospiraceae bacterium]
MEGVGVPVQHVEPQRRAETLRRVCLISLGGELYAIDLRSVREVFEVESVTPVPGMPAALVGVANLRGVVIPLVDLRFLLGLPVSGPPPQFAVVVRHGSRQVGVLVEQVPEIRNLQKDQFLPAVQTARAESRPFVSTVLRIEDRLGGVLEVPIVFEHMESGGAS